MCAPIIGLAAAGISGVLGTVAKVQQDQVQAQVADQNAAAERAAAAQDQTNMNQAALQRYMQISQTEGQQRATQAANGVVVDFGTAKEQVSDTALLGSMDVNKIYQTGFQAQRGHDVAIGNDVATARAARSNAVLTGIAGGFGAAASFLGGANQYGMLASKFGIPSGASGATSNFGMSNGAGAMGGAFG
jgi:hypothetical protein